MPYAEMYSSPYGAYPSASYYPIYWEQAPPHYTNPDRSSSTKHGRYATVPTEEYCVYTMPDGTRYYAAAPEQSRQRPSSSHHRHHHRHEKSSRHREPRAPKTTRTAYDIHVDQSGNVRYYTTTEQEPARRDPYEDEEDSAYGYKYRTTPPPQEQYHHHTRQSHSYPGAYTQRSHHYERPTKPTRPEPPRRTKSTRHTTARHAEPSAARREATDSDRRKAGIPAGYSLKHWDPLEQHILLAGSVFDANSLGKWIYDWTVAAHGPATPLTEIAGDLWLLLIQLAGKIKRAEERVALVRDRDDRELIEEFLDSGDRLWSRFAKLLKICEAYMMKGVKKSSSSKKATLGSDSGVMFIKCIFGRDKELVRTEKVMAGIRLWSMRFDANCDDILRRA